jgi:hypothetical protein
MANIKVAQEVNGEDPDGVTSGLTIAATFTVAANSVIHVFATCFGTSTTATCADNVNAGNYTATGSSIDDTTVGVRLFQFRKEAVAAGSTTVTVTFSGTITGKGIRILEIQNVATSSALDVVLAGNYQPTPTTTTDATVSGSASNTVTGLVVGLTYDSAEGSTNSAGTGFTTGTSGWVFGSGSNLALTENKRVTTIASQTATFTATANDGHLTIGAVYKELVGPTINTQPTTQTVAAGQTATFTISATASAGGGSLSYQWKKGGSNVGTNSSSYTTAATVGSDDASIITCVVTDSNGSTTSADTVYLRVFQSPPAAWVTH